MSARAHAAAFVAHFLGAPRRDVPRRQVPEARVQPLEVVVALALGNLVGRAPVAALPRHPDATVVAKRLAHEGELRLVVPGHGDAGRVNLRKAGVGERRAALVGPPDGGHVAALGVGGEVVDVRIAAGREHDGVAGVSYELPVHQAARDDAAGPPVDHHHVEQLRARIHPHLAGGDLARQRLVGAEQQLLPRLAARVKGARYLDAAERAVGEQAAVLARERYALGRALVDDGGADLGQPIDVRFTRAEVASLDRVVEQPEHGIAVVLVVLRRVDAALRRDRVRPPGRVLEAEARDGIPELGERRRRGRPCEPGADDDDVVLELVRRVDEPDLGAVPLPFVGERAGGNLGPQLHGHRSQPASTASGIAT